MYHFFAEHENIFDDYIDIKGGDVNHIKNVLRLKKGDEILISSGDNYDYNCIIDTITDDYVRSLITSVNEKGNELSSKVYLFQGLPKADKMELIIQKMIELGVYEIVPVAMKRSVVKLDDKKAKSKVARWNTIAESAAKQSKRSIMPKVSDVVSFKQAVAMASELDVLLLPYECAEGIEYTRQVIASIGKGKSIGIFIGPEGGFDKDDVLNQVREMKDAAYAEKSKLIKEKKEQEKQIQELKKQLAKKDSEKAAALQKQKEAHKEEIAHLEERIQEKQKQKEKLEREISEKYQKYIDRYDLIGGLVLESEEKAEKIIREANEKAEQVLNDADQQAETTTQNARKAADQIVSEAIATRDELMDEAKKEAEKCLAAVQAEVDAKLADGKRKYIAVQDEMNEIVELINQAQIRFMASYKEVHKIVSAMPETMRELEDEEASRKKEDESTVAAQNNLQTGESEYEEDLDEEEEDFSEEEMKQMMNRQDEE